jgi:hypothetical protein
MEPISQQDLLIALGAARDRHQSLFGTIWMKGYRDRLERGHSISKTDRFSHWLSRHYMIIFNLIVFMCMSVCHSWPQL